MECPKKPKRAVAAAAVIAVGLLGTPAAVHAQVAPGVAPLLDCVSFDYQANVVTAHYGYINANADAVPIPVGGSNHFTPGPTNNGQPRSFDPGIHHEVFTVQFSLVSTTQLTWDLDGASIDATNAVADYCDGERPAGSSSAPAVVGSPILGGTLAATAGWWTGSPAPTIAYQWQRDDGAGGWTDVGGATGPTHDLVGDDLGHALRIEVTGANAHGPPVTVTSPATGSVTAPEDATPDGLSFPPKVGVDPGTAVVSAPATISGINVLAPISIAGGEYALGGGPFTSGSGTVASGDVVALRVTAPAEYAGSAVATVTVGGAQGVFVVVTKPEPQSAAAAGNGGVQTPAPVVSPLPVPPGTGGVQTPAPVVPLPPVVASAGRAQTPGHRAPRPSLSALRRSGRTLRATVSAPATVRVSLQRCRRRCVTVRRLSARARRRGPVVIRLPRCLAHGHYRAVVTASNAAGTTRRALIKRLTL